MTEAAPQFLDVQTLLEASEPRPRIPWTQFLIGGFVLAFILSWYISHSSQPGESQDLMASLIGMGLMAFVGSIAFANFVGVRRARAEHAAVAAVEELMQLRRWP